MTGAVAALAVSTSAQEKIKRCDMNNFDLFVGRLMSRSRSFSVSPQLLVSCGSPEDIKMDEVSAYVANLEAQMTNVAKVEKPTTSPDFF
jgi:hypothetical protein